MNNEFQIGHLLAGPRQKPLIVAELSGNHNGNLNRALSIIDAAANAGVDAIKIQTYTADTMTLNVRSKGFIIESKNSLWKGKALYDLYEEAYTPWEWHSKLIERAKNLDLVIFSTPFDESAVDFLEELSFALCTRTKDIQALIIQDLLITDDSFAPS